MVKWSRDDLFYILIKSLDVFCLFAENLSEAELKSNCLICMEKFQDRMAFRLCMVMAQCTYPIPVRDQHMDGMKKCPIL